MTTPVSPYIHLVGGKFLPAGSSAELDGLFQAAQASPAAKNLVIHFHGGLVGEAAALQSAGQVLAPAFTQAGAIPMFVIWHSDLLTTLTRRLTAILQTKAFWRLVRRSTQFAAGAYFGESGGKGDDELDLPSLRDVPDSPEGLEQFWRQREEKGPPNPVEELSKAQQDQVRRELEKDRALQGELQEELDAPTAPLFSRDVLEKLAADGAEAGDKVGPLTLMAIGWKGVEFLHALISRRRSGRHHGWHDTIVQEVLRGCYLDNVGTAVWEAIKRDAVDAFAGDPAVHGGTALIEQLRRAWQPDLRVTLTGHSTGAIFIGRFLEAVDRVLPADARFDVVLLAPACTFQFLLERLAILQRRVRDLRLFGLRDERESSYWEVPLLSRGSLLYIVSGLLESEADMPILGMQRYYSRRPPYDTAALAAVGDYLAGKTVWAEADDGDGRRSSARTHGGMVEEPRTLASLQRILRRGF
jgi:hypothetical protein